MSPLLRIVLPLWILSAFLTQAKFIPGIENNATPFEIVGLLIVLVVLLRERAVPWSPTEKWIGGMLVLALLSQINLRPENRTYAIVQIGILAFLLGFVWTLRTLAERDGLTPEFLLRWITFAVLVFGPWIVWQGLDDSALTVESGPFRNRAHMASYMATAFWLCVTYSLWPGIGKIQRFAAAGGIVFSLYAVAVSGRRSVYLALFLGFVALAVALTTLGKRRRGAMLLAGLFAVATLLGLYRFGAAYLPDIVFFQDRLGLIDDRLTDALGTSEEDSMQKSFFDLQKEGVAMAVREHPLLGIGWGGFPDSRYSPTGHEVHSTPLRFLAEMGFAGLVLYVGFMAHLLHRSARLFFWMRETPYEGVYLTLATAFWSLCVSYAYNRHITERTFWLMLGVIVVSDVFARAWHAWVAKGAPAVRAA